MDEFYQHDPLRDRLIVAGLDEIAQHGIAGFSLRRVSAACGASCAAPYKHFKNKEELIMEIIRYANQQWELLRDQVIAVAGDDPLTQITEVCIAYTRFWIANPNYHFALNDSAEEQLRGKTESPNSVTNLIRRYCLANGNSEEMSACKICAIKAMLYGVTAMLDRAEIGNTPKTYGYIRAVVRTILISDIQPHQI